ncbi:SixA phosphatase family protein [Puniceibacterium sediminis]|uniref:Phosphohistidine phosphatase n=1 Tax=Puniceibacterium sediminis TaxID=1608407 RepID=A0A238X628_9RHOB|nr:histidine phosphatase family protein [Puniceibacterium sediminis]SNR54041.1 phosphohistidine phosphatase [Puniceibacterium sediminis]
MRLILMRHTKSDWSLDEEDHARALNPRGEASARILGEWLRAENYLPDQVLCSTSARTRQTLSLLQLSAPVQFERELYLASPELLLEILRGATGRVVLMLGHNPGIAALAAMLASVYPSHIRFRDYPTGATTIMDFDIPKWADLVPGTGNARDFVIPRELMSV